MTVEEALERLESFKGLESGWDSYGGYPISHVAVDRAAALVGHLFVVPACDGSVIIYLGPEQEVELCVAVDGSVRMEAQDAV